MASAVNFFQVNGLSPTGWSGGNPQSGDIAQTSDGKLWFCNNGSDDRNIASWTQIGTAGEIQVGVDIQDEGLLIKDNAQILNFIGASISASTSGDTVNIDVSSNSVDNLVFEQTIPYTQFRTIFSNPIELIPAPGVGKIISAVGNLTITRLAGSQTFNFINNVMGISYNRALMDNINAGASWPYQIDVQGWLNNASTKGVMQFSISNNLGFSSGFLQTLENLPLVLGVDNNGNATQGDCDVKIKFEYKIIDV